MAGLLGDLDNPGPSGNDLGMDQINPLPALTQDEVRVGACAEVRELLQLQLAPLGRLKGKTSRQPQDIRQVNGKVALPCMPKSSL